MAKTQVLVVHQEGWEVQLPGHLRAHALCYRFIDPPYPDSFSAWRVAQDPESELIEVASSCRVFSGGYSQHALNRFFSQAVLRYQPTVVLLAGINGCTVDLPRVSSLLNVPVVLLLDAPVEPPVQLASDTRTWLQAAFAACECVVPSGKDDFDQWPGTWFEQAQVEQPGALPETVMVPLLDCAAGAQEYDYSLYEFCQRDHPLLVGMQMRDTRHFQGCEQVLDLACGVGIFLDCLRREGISARGVERDERIAAYARGMGLDVKTADALQHLEAAADEYDGIYCSHFVEHLPIEGVQQLVGLLARTLAPGGVLVLAFPDPESIRSQLLGFWRDPEHVRFYHPELVATLATAAGLELEWSSYDEQPHTVVSFSEHPPEIPPVCALPMLEAVADQGTSRGLLSRIFEGLGMVPASRLTQLEQRLERWSEALQQESDRQVQASRVLEERTATLWDISRTWAWNDNVTLKLRKPAR